MRLLTDEQHAQIVEALKASRGMHYTVVIPNEQALATLTAAPSLEVVGYAYEHQDHIGSVIGAAGEWAPNEIALYAIKKETP